MFTVPVAFDEDFEGELADNHDTRTEVSLLAKGPDPELTKVGYISNWITVDNVVENMYFTAALWHLQIIYPWQWHSPDSLWYAYFRVSLGTFNMDPLVSNNLVCSYD